MDKIFFDIGNTRTKFASIEGKHYQFHGAVVNSELSEYIENELFELFDAPTAVYFVGVGNLKLQSQIQQLIEQEWGVIPVKLHSQLSCCGLTSGYQDFEHLGVDRWMAMLGASSMTKDPFIVIDAGTAVTIDAVMDGQHKGGFIVPGLRLQHRSLMNGTANIELPSEPNDNSLNDSLLALNTEDAIWGGTLYMLSAYLNEIVSDLNAQMDTQFKVFLTGGDAPLLGKLLSVKTIASADLVLKGAAFYVNRVNQKKS